MSLKRSTHITYQTALLNTAEWAEYFNFRRTVGFCLEKMNNHVSVDIKPLLSYTISVDDFLELFHWYADSNRISYVVDNFSDQHVKVMIIRGYNPDSSRGVKRPFIN